jgi:hypothetical protein
VPVPSTFCQWHVHIQEACISIIEQGHDWLSFIWALKGAKSHFIVDLGIKHMIKKSFGSLWLLVRVCGKHVLASGSDAGPDQSE